jgi:hypothetical protein
MHKTYETEERPQRALLVSIVESSAAQGNTESFSRELKDIAEGYLSKRPPADKYVPGILRT